MNPNTKTIVFLSVLTLILAILGFTIGSFVGAFIFLMFGVIIDICSYFLGDRFAIYSASAREVSEKEAPEIYSDLKELSAKFSMPIPKLYFSPSQQANAFATGRDLNHSSICFTEGILSQLTREQIRAVMAHELAHIRHRDVLIGTVAALISGSIASIAQFGGFLDSDNEEEEKSANPIVSVLLVIFSPIAALILQLGVSREREYGADYASAKLTGNPQDLIDALINISSSVNVFPMDVNPGFSSLYILNPLKLKGIMELFATHPSLEERIKRIQTF
ncbi:MAG: M48 family metalloprotease [Candidatus Dojkabacteria bacterium]